jgi:hypothetical protein
MVAYTWPAVVVSGVLVLILFDLLRMMLAGIAVCTPVVTDLEQ